MLTLILRLLCYLTMSLGLCAMLLETVTGAVVVLCGGLGLVVLALPGPRASRPRTLFGSLIAALFLIPLASCLATSGDLGRIATRMEAGEVAIEAKLQAFSEGMATAEEVTATIREAWGGNVQEVREVAKVIQERTKEGVDLTWQSLLALLATQTGLGVAATNAYRNRHLPGSHRA